jgi:hypothetical protein
MKRLQRQIIATMKIQMAGGKARLLEGSHILWNAFASLTRQRTWHASGPNPISFGEIEAYCRLMCLPLGPQHIEVILAMDRAWVDNVAAQITAPDAKHAPQVSKQPLTAALLDLVLG